MENLIGLMNYSMGEIPPAEVLRLLLKHGIRRIPVAAIHELFNVVTPHLSFFEKSAVSLLISTFYKEDLAALLKDVEKRPSLRALPKSLMYDTKFTSILRKYIDGEKFASFQFDVFNFGEAPPIVKGGAAASDASLIATATANGTLLPSNILGPSRRATFTPHATLRTYNRNTGEVTGSNSTIPISNKRTKPSTTRTGPRRKTRNRSRLPIATTTTINDPDESNENSSNELTEIGYTGPRRNYPNLKPVILPGIVRAPHANSLAPRYKGQVGYKNIPAPPTLEMPRPKPTGVPSLFTGEYRRVTRRRHRT